MEIRVIVLFLYIYIQVYNTFIPNNIVMKIDKSLGFGAFQRGLFSLSFDIDGGSRYIYLYSYGQKSYIFCVWSHFPSSLMAESDDTKYIWGSIFDKFEDSFDIVVGTRYLYIWSFYLCQALCEKTRMFNIF